MLLDYCKWDPQVGDERVLLSQPMVIDSATWTMLKAAAERMALEISEAEKELLRKPNLLEKLGMPAPLSRQIGSHALHGETPGVRTLRFDFHPTQNGWKVSEVNSDVPGGFTEASHFTTLMAEHYPEAPPAGNPLRAWTRAMEPWLKEGHIAILYAPGYMEDQQIATLLGNALRHEGCSVHFVQHPGGLSWRDGTAFVDGFALTVPLDAIVRFYQAEWLAQLPRKSGWTNLFSRSRTVITNPGHAVLAESKRFPLVWPELSCSTEMLQAMFPECQEPHALNSPEENWVFKPAYSNTGENVIMPALLATAEWSKLRRSVLRHSHTWVAQRRFRAQRVETDGGEYSPCIGVYTINGRAEGAYIRLTRGAIVDYRSCEAALLVERPWVPLP
jgi:glutathionylspermidine synthase